MRKPNPRPTNLLRSRLRMSQLELLAAMGRTSSLSAAAREVNLTQPAASRLVNSLSVDLGITLFERGGRALVPTSAGLTLMRKAAEFLADLDRTQDELEAIEGGLVGTTSIGAGFASCYVLIPEAITLLAKNAPRIAVTVHEGAMNELVGQLREGIIDLIIGRFESETSFKDLEVENLYSPLVRVVCGVQHPLASKRNPSWAELLGESWILPESGTPMRGAVEALFRREGTRPRSALIESSAIPTNVALLSTLNVIWVLSEDVSEYFSRLGALHVLNVAPLEAPGSFILGHLSRRRMSPSTQRVRDCVLEAARKARGRR
jgi:DNA-binding transcriptional LysR family regulator